MPTRRPVPPLPDAVLAHPSPTTPTCPGQQPACPSLTARPSPVRHGVSPTPTAQPIPRRRAGQIAPDFPRQPRTRKLWPAPTRPDYPGPLVPSPLRPLSATDFPAQDPDRHSSRRPNPTAQPAAGRPATARLRRPWPISNRPVASRQADTCRLMASPTNQTSPRLAAPARVRLAHPLPANTPQPDGPRLANTALPAARLPCPIPTRLPVPPPA
jgi:hypothetical protein